MENMHPRRHVAAASHIKTARRSASANHAQENDAQDTPPPEEATPDPQKMQAHVPARGHVPIRARVCTCAGSGWGASIHG